MGVTLSKLFDKLFSKMKESRILMIGLDAAGKTTILYKLNLGEALPTVPTIGFNVEVVQYKKIKFTVFDIGGQTKIRALWKHYFENTDAIIYVIDSSDPNRIELSRKELESVLSDDLLKNAALLIYANKQDTSSVGVKELAEQLQLSKHKDRKWFIQGSCALTGEGLYDGLDWMSEALKEKE